MSRFQAYRRCQNRRCSLHFIKSLTVIFLIIGTMVQLTMEGRADEMVTYNNVKYWNIVETLLPEAYSSFPNELRHDVSIKAARASTVLIARARKALEKSTKTTNRFKDVADASRMAWAISLRIWKHTKDEAARGEVLNAWNSSLREENIQTPSQICALSEEWDRNLLTDSFWRVFTQTGERKIISSICYVISRHGNKEDKIRLMAKRDALAEPELKQIVQNALNWMKYWRLDDRSLPGPAAAPPRVVR